MRIGLLTSGGDAPGMNAAIRAVVLGAHHHHIETIGFIYGYNGVINDETKTLTPDSVGNIIHRGGTILKSARCKEMLSDSGLKQAASTLLKHKIDALIVIGGDGSFRGLLSLKAHWHGQIIGIPGTIDNDVDKTDYTIGYSTALNTAIEAIDKIRDTADAFERVFIVEVMGRHSGFLAFNAGIASGAEQVLSFENFSVDNAETKLQELANDIKRVVAKRHASYIIVIAENLWNGGAHQLSKQLKSTADIDCTACILGHIQRGGSPVAKDRILATKMGVASIQAVLSGRTGVMTGELNNEVKLFDLSETIKHSKKVSQNIIDAQQDILAINAQLFS
jgi:6-phosphofructokinase 1